MDDRTFDHLAKTLSATPSRRGLLAGLLAVTSLGAADAAARRKGRGKGKGKGKDKDKGGNGGCTPEPKATVCAGRCGPVSNRQTCGKTVQCDPCVTCAANGSTNGSSCTPAGGGTGICTGATCEACGGPGEPCCAGATPCANFGCCDPANDRCVAGGGIWGVDFEPECAGTHAVCDCQPQLTYYDPTQSGNGDTRAHFTCTQPGVCRPNHAPRAFGQSIRNPWRWPCVPITLAAFDNDYNHVFFRITRLPQSGRLTEFVSRHADAPAAAHAAGAGDSPRDPNNPPKWGGLDSSGVAGWTTGEPPLPPPDAAPRDCAPRCLDGDACAGNGTCPDCGIDRWDTGGSDYRECPEAWYQQAAFCYIPFQSTFTGFDSFEFAAFDQHGAESEPATVNIEIFECGVPCI